HHTVVQFFVPLEIYHLEHVVDFGINVIHFCIKTSLKKLTDRKLKLVTWNHLTRKRNRKPRLHCHRTIGELKPASNDLKNCALACTVLTHERCLGSTANRKCYLIEDGFKCAVFK